MGRPLRNEQPGAIYHVLARGVNRQRIFVDDEDYRTYTRLLATVTRRQGWHLLSYCLMPNHVHLLIETPETNLGNGMQWLHGMYALEFNKRHRRVGHVFQDRFKSPVVASEEAVVRLVGYIAVNPVAAALCARAAEWPWSSHAVVVSPDFAPSWIAQGRLVQLLEQITGSRCYLELVGTAERAHY